MKTPNLQCSYCGLEQNEWAAKVSEQEKEIERLKLENEALGFLSKKWADDNEKLTKVNEELKVMWSRTKENQKVSEQSQRIQQQDSELKKLHREFTDQAIKIDEKNIKIQQLEEALREAQKCIKQNTPESWVTNDWMELVQKIEALLSPPITQKP